MKRRSRRAQSALTPPVTALAAARKGRAATPWRKSRPLHAVASAAPGWDGRSLADFVPRPWRGSSRSASLPRACQPRRLPRLRRCLTGCDRSAKNAERSQPAITPIPLAGGFGWPRNITRDYAQGAGRTRPKQRASAPRPLSASPHNPRYVQWPRSAKGAL